MRNQSGSNEDTAGDGNSLGATSKKIESQHSSNGETTPRYVNGHSGEGHIKIYDSHRPALSGRSIVLVVVKMLFQPPPVSIGIVETDRSCSLDFFVEFFVLCLCF